MAISTDGENGLGGNHIAPSSGIGANIQVAKPQSVRTKGLLREAEVRKTRVLTSVVIITNVIGNVSLSRGMHQVGRIVSASPLDYVRAVSNPWVIEGACVLLIWMITYLALLSRADLSFVLPVTASAYVLIAISGHFLLYERVSWVRWVGIVVITLGAVLVLETPVRTTEGPPEHLL